MPTNVFVLAKKKKSDNTGVGFHNDELYISLTVHIK